MKPDRWVLKGKMQGRHALAYWLSDKNTHFYVPFSLFFLPSITLRHSHTSSKALFLSLLSQTHMLCSLPSYLTQSHTHTLQMISGLQSIQQVLLSAADAVSSLDSKTLRSSIKCSFSPSLVFVGQSSAGSKRWNPQRLVQQQGWVIKKFWTCRSSRLSPNLLSALFNSFISSFDMKTE